MRIAATIASVFSLLLPSGPAFSADADLGNSLDRDAVQAAKDARTFGVPSPVTQSGGEDIATATVIPSLPYLDSGSTCGYQNDYDATCPYTGSLSPDVVYRYTPANDTAIDVDLCNSSYDTKVYLYENTVGQLVACNDDECGSDGFRSLLTLVPLTSGNTYYIVVDGYGGDCGEYDLTVVETIKCYSPCPPGGVDEGEGNCYAEYDDQYNGGCNSSPPVFTTIPCTSGGSTVTICGRQGGFTYQDLDYRDTDWYEVPAELNPDGLTVCLSAEYYQSFFAVLQPDCEDIQIVDSAIPYCWERPCFDLPANAGYWIFVAVADWGPDVGCYWLYDLDITGSRCPPVSVEPASWGWIKGRYR